jgi:hypothetical protein
MRAALQTRQTSVLQLGSLPPPAFKVQLAAAFVDGVKSGEAQLLRLGMRRAELGRENPEVPELECIVYLWSCPPASQPSKYAPQVLSSFNARY